jgi:hypothetical protein
VCVCVCVCVYALLESNSGHMPLPADAPYPEECLGNTWEEVKKGKEAKQLEPRGLQHGARPKGHLRLLEPPRPPLTVP